MDEVGLSINDFIKAKEKLVEIATFYYATNEYIDKGSVVIAEATETTPKFLVFHPDDLETIKSGIEAGGFILVPMKNWVPKLPRLNPVFVEPNDDHLKWRWRSRW